MLLTPAAAQLSTQNGNKPPAPLPAGSGGAAKASPTRDAGMEGLPTFLKLVPGGTVEIGIEAAELVDAACQVVSPTRPETAAKSSETKVKDAMRRSLSLLGQRTVNVEAFWLATWPVKCSEYDTFVVAQRKAGAKIRPPFLQWREGCPEDFTKRLPDINRLFPKMDDGPLQYWDRLGDELPYNLKDKDGKSIVGHPVTGVTWKDANVFAAAVGMRLPTEPEWTRAARGDGKHLWPHAVVGDATSDHYSELLLKQLQIYNSRDQVLKAVGTVKGAVGPFGHVDMFGQVWQMVGTLGFRPINGVEALANEWKALQKDKVGALVTGQPEWKDDRAIGKGGSFLSSGEPIQLLIDARAPMQTNDVLDGLGFRLAKSMRPGYDVLYSMVRGFYNKSPFATDQDVNLAAQIGGERYEVGADGFPTDYQAVSFAPVNWLTKEKNIDMAKLLESSQTKPVLIGTLVTRSAMLEPVAPAGLYSVLFRKAGVPKELVDAIKQGAKELSKGNPKGDEPAEGDGGKDKGDKSKKVGWREVIARFGLTEKDLEGKDALDGKISFVRVDTVEVAIEHDWFLLHGNEGKVVAAWRATAEKPATGAPIPSEFALEPNAAGKLLAKMHFAMPLASTNEKRVVDFHLHVTLDLAAPAADKPWRLPVK